MRLRALTSSGTGTRAGVAALALCCCAGALAAGARAGGSFAPRIAVTLDGGTTTIHYQQTWTDSVPAALDLYAPAGVTASLAAAPGTKIGTVEALGVATDLGGNGRLPLSGPVTAAAATDPVVVGGTGTTLAAAAQACIGSQAPTAYWILSLSAPGLPVRLPVFVSKTDSGPFSGRLRLSLCPPSPDLPADAAGRSPLGIRLLDLTVTLPKIFAGPTSGWQRWYLRATPYARGSGTLDPAGAVEAQARDGSPKQLTLTAAKAGPANVVRLDGTLEQAGKPIAGQRVRILVAGRVVSRPKTDASGRFTTERRVTSPTTFTAAATVAERKSACADPAFAPLPCVSATTGRFVATSRPVRVKAS